jgi:hypothetical protein
MVATVPRVLTYCSACAVPAPETNFCDGPTSARRLLESVAQRQMCTQVIDACAAAHDEGTRNDHSQAEADHRRALMSFGVAIAGLGLGQGTAQALPGGPVPLGSWPGCPEDNPSGPCLWCPGDPPVQTGNLRVNPVIWDNNVCHKYWYVYHGQGNVAQNIFEGEFPPPPPPPPPNLTPPLPPG